MKTTKMLAVVAVLAFGMMFGLGGAARAGTIPYNTVTYTYITPPSFVWPPGEVAGTLLSNGLTTGGAALWGGDADVFFDLGKPYKLTAVQSWYEDFNGPSRVGPESMRVRAYTDAARTNKVYDSTIAPRTWPSWIDDWGEGTYNNQTGWKTLSATTYAQYVQFTGANPYPGDLNLALNEIQFQGNTQPVIAGSPGSGTLNVGAAPFGSTTPIVGGDLKIENQGDSNSDLNITSITGLPSSPWSLNGLLPGSLTGDGTADFLGTDTTTLQFRFNPTGLAAGTYTHDITINSDGGNLTYTLSATVQAAQGGAVPEPAGLSLIGLGLLVVRKRRS
jgi:hypothetical protein